MSEHLNRAQRYHEAIRGVLLKEWDPIGVAEVPQAQDEYDSYIHEIHGMLIRHESKTKITDHLSWIETEHMGLYGNRARTEAAASRLLALRDDLERAN
jgi:hypothetical protein